MGLIALDMIFTGIRETVGRRLRDVCSKQRYQIEINNG